MQEYKLLLGAYFRCRARADKAVGSCRGSARARLRSVVDNLGVTRAIVALYSERQKERLRQNIDISTGRKYWSFKMMNPMEKVSPKSVSKSTVKILFK